MAYREIVLDYLNCTLEERWEKAPRWNTPAEESECYDAILELIQDGLINTEQYGRVYSCIRANFSPSNNLFGKQLIIMTWLADQGCGSAQCELVELHAWMDDWMNLKDSQGCAKFVPYYSREKKMKYAQMAFTSKDSEALGEVGYWFDSGRYGYEKNQETALQFYLKAVENGKKGIWGRIGKLYKDLGMPQKALEAYMKTIRWDAGKVVGIDDDDSECIGMYLFSVAVYTDVAVTDAHICAIKQLALFNAQHYDDTSLQGDILHFEKEHGAFSATVLNRLKQERRRRRTGL